MKRAMKSEFALSTSSGCCPETGRPSSWRKWRHWTKSRKCVRRPRTALGQIHGKSSIEVLHKMLTDGEPSVVLAAASALIPSKDPAAYEAYYEFLTGERKTGTD